MNEAVVTTDGYGNVTFTLGNDCVTFNLPMGPAGPPGPSLDFPSANVGDVLMFDGHGWSPMPLRPPPDPMVASTLREMAKLNGAGFLGLI